MYQSIVQYHSEMIIEKSFRQLVAYTDHRLTQKDMKLDADMFYKKQSFLKMMVTAQQLAEYGVEEADSMYTQRLQVRVIDALRTNIALKQEKAQKLQKASVFEEIWTKTKVLRAFAMHNLMIQ